MFTRYFWGFLTFKSPQDISAWMAGTGAAKASMSLSERARRLEELQRSTSEVERGTAKPGKWWISMGKNRLW
jgi:hypothetical protein